MKKIYQVLLVAAAVVLVAALAYLTKGGTRVERYQARFTDVFDTVTEITGYAKKEPEFSRQVSELKEQLDQYHKLFDIYHEYEGIQNISTINRQAGIAPVKVDPAVIELLKLGKEMYEITAGQVNIAYGSVLSVWHDYREAGMADPARAQLPPAELLAERAMHTDIQNLVIDAEQSTVYLADPEMSLDVGSIGKGFAVQKTAEYAREQGMDHLLISAGGNVCTVGTRADGTAWKVGVQNPDTDSSQAYVQTIDAADCSVVTSGDYQRYYEVDQKRYCHIIDVDTGRPAEHMAVVTVVTKDSGRADAWSTALFCMTYEEGRKLVDSKTELEAMWVLKDGTIRYSDGFQTNRSE